jgi:hypothetical protein
MGTRERVADRLPVWIQGHGPQTGVQQLPPTTQGLASQNQGAQRSLTLNSIVCALSQYISESSGPQELLPMPCWR